MENKLLTGKELLDSITERIKSKNWKKYKFNIFNACGIENKELVHSSFIANLFDPSGTHSQGNLFLKLFLSTLKAKYGDINVDKLSDNVWVNTEHAVSDGRIDIWIKSKTENAYLVIENKISAGDGENQILKYRQYLNGQSQEHNEKRKGILLYLTVNGKDASKFSTGNKVAKNQPDGYYTISYYSTIKDWLSKCMELDLPCRVQIAIEQYLELVEFMNFDANLRDELLPDINKELISGVLKKVEKDNMTDKQIKSFLEYLHISCEKE